MSLKQTLSTIPENTNLLQPNKYLFSIPDLTHLNYFCQSVVFPSVSTSEAIQETEHHTVYRHGDKLIYEPLTLTFLVDEDLKNWEEIFAWLAALTAPEGYTQYATNQNHFLYHDAIIEFTTNSRVSNFRVKFHNCHPTSLGSIQFDETIDANMPMVSDVTFRYDYFTFERPQ